jgi:hypothetical protein
MNGRFLKITIKFLILSLLIFVNCSVHASELVKNYILSSHPYRLTAQIFFDKETGKTGKIKQGTFYVKFSSSDKKHGKTINVECGPGFSNDPLIDSHDYIHLGRNQVFIWSEMGACYSHIYDYNGKKVRTIYSRTAGRVSVDLVKKKNWHWQMIEGWSRYPFMDAADLGVGFSSGIKDDIGVERTLHWDRKKQKFMPDLPGDSVIKLLPKGKSFKHSEIYLQKI